MQSGFPLTLKSPFLLLQIQSCKNGTEFLAQKVTCPHCPFVHVLEVALGVFLEHFHSSRNSTVFSSQQNTMVFDCPV